MNDYAKPCLGALAVAAAIAVAGTTFAGAKTYPQVTVNLSAGTASGAMGTARRIAGNQYIGCDVVESSLSAECSALDPFGNQISCIYPINPGDNRPAMTVTTINPDSYISFKWLVNNGINYCTYLQVINSSEYEPKPN